MKNSILNAVGALANSFYRGTYLEKGDFVQEAELWLASAPKNKPDGFYIIGIKNIFRKLWAKTKVVATQSENMDTFSDFKLSPLDKIIARDEIKERLLNMAPSVRKRQRVLKEALEILGG